MVNYIYMQIHKEIFFSKILYSFIETYFPTNENPYGRSVLLRRRTYVSLNYNVHHTVVHHPVHRTTNRTVHRTVHHTVPRTVESRASWQCAHQLSPPERD